MTAGPEGVAPQPVAPSGPTADPEDLICGCGDGLSARQDAQCGNCIAADRSGLELRYEAMRSVARRLNDDWFAMEDHTGTLRWRKRSWNPPKWEDATPDERRALDELEADRG